MEKEASLHEEDEDGAWSNPSFLSELSQAEANTGRRFSSSGGGGGGGGGGHSSCIAATQARTLDSSKRGRTFGDCERIDSTTPHASSSLHSGRDAAASHPSKKPQHASGGEGEYIAALRGNHSRTWQAMNAALLAENPAASRWYAGSTGSNGSGNVLSPAMSNAGATGACYKCGKDGHWARDCTLAAGGGKAYKDGFQSFDGAASFPEKKCPCDAGICLILTANTEKNPGRKFYRCPLNKDEGGCGYFEWCDSTGTGTNHGCNGVKILQSDVQCPCGAGPCIQLTAKTDKNMGRQFFRCPLNQGEGYCGFFKWCDEVASDAKGKSAEYVDKIGESNGFLGKSAACSGSCFKCGKDGHWSKDCSSKPLSESGNAIDKSLAHSFGTQGTSGICSTCFKCGQTGHWSSNCTSPQIGSFHPSNNTKGATAGNCYKCGMEGHWSTNCPGNLASRNSFKQGNTSFHGSGTTGGLGNSGSCYKCGGEGHWANSCTAQVAGSYGNNKLRGSYGRRS